MEKNLILQRLMLLVPLLLSLTVHEWAHAWSANRLGDDTALRQGRLTLNPLAHIDLFGTILLPLMGVPFGWAKPVPVNPARFRRDVSMRKGMMLTAAAGPLSNVLIAVACAIVLGLALRLRPEILMSQNGGPAMFLQTAIGLNLALAIFNLLPIPPLDGSRVAEGLMPARWQSQWESFCKIGPFVLLAVIFAPQLFGVHLIGWPVEQATRVIRSLILVIAGV